MKLPIQAEPVLRNSNTVKISVASGITATNGGGLSQTQCGLDELGNAVEECQMEYCAPTTSELTGWFCADGGAKVGQCIVKANNWWRSGCLGTFNP